MNANDSPILNPEYLPGQFALRIAKISARGVENIRQTFELRNDAVIGLGEIEVGAEWTACWGNFRTVGH
jgi:hypothetical protein